jgi:hypothetical protein
MGKRRKRIGTKKFKELLADPDQDLSKQLSQLIVCRSEPFELELREADGQLVPAVSGESGLERTFTISTPVVDRDGDILDTQWELDNFNKGGSVLFGHNLHDPRHIVAAPKSTWLEEKRLRSRAEFTPRDINPLGYMVLQLIDFNALRGSSVGFRPIEFEEAKDRDGWMPINYGRKELLEWSVTPVPANPEALVGAKDAGIDLTPFVPWAEEVLDSDTDLVVVSRDIVEASWQVVKGKTSRSTVVLPAVVDKGAISYGSAHSEGTPKAAEDEAWSGPKETAAAEVVDLKVMCTWLDSESSDTKGAYKLPHHRAAGQHAVVWNGVSAAMGALLGARGGVDIPNEDRKAVYNHLAKHYKEFDKEVPEFKELTDEGKCWGAPASSVDDAEPDEIDIQEEIDQLNKRLTSVLTSVEQLATKLVGAVESTVKAFGRSPLSDECVARLRSVQASLGEVLQRYEVVGNQVDGSLDEPSAFDRAFEALEEWPGTTVENASTEVVGDGVTAEQLRDIASEVLGEALTQLTGRLPDQLPPVQ